MLVVPKFRFFLLVIWFASRMLRMVIARVWALLSAIGAKVSLFLLVVLTLACRMLGVVIPSVCTLLHAIFLQSFGFFANNFKVGL